MREIKFRAWSIPSKSMSPGNKTIPEWIEFMIDNAEKEIMYVTLRSLVFQQFTGLKDKNGKEIYEGDIIKDSADEIATVEYMRTREPRFEANANSGNILNFTETDLEIIGNIYENPELLK